MVDRSDDRFYRGPELQRSVPAGPERHHHRPGRYEGRRRHDHHLRRRHAGGGSDRRSLHGRYHIFLHQDLSGLRPGYASGPVYQGSVLLPVGSGQVRHAFPHHPHHQRRQPAADDDADAAAYHHHHAHSADRRHCHVPEAGCKAQRDPGLHYPHYNGRRAVHHPEIPSLVQAPPDPGGSIKPDHAGKAHRHPGHPGLCPDGI